MNFYGFPFPTRMTVVRLSNGELWVHSPEKINKDLQEELLKLGNVSYLISPNKLHHLFLEEWIKIYPNAKNYATLELIKKRKDIKLSKELKNTPEDEWKKEINQLIFKGSFAMEEAVFFHKASKTLILTDLIENFKPETLTVWQRNLAKFAGILSPNGKTPIDWRASFIFGKNKAKESLEIMLSWKPTNIILSHGECIKGNGFEFLKKSFSWLK